MNEKKNYQKPMPLNTESKVHWASEEADLNTPYGASEEADLNTPTEQTEQKIKEKAIMHEFSVAYSVCEVDGAKELHVFFVKGEFGFQEQQNTDKAVFGDLGIKGYKKALRPDFDESKFSSAEVLRMYGEIYEFATGAVIESEWSVIQPKLNNQ